MTTIPFHRHTYDCGSPEGLCPTRQLRNFRERLVNSMPDSRAMDELGTARCELGTVSASSTQIGNRASGERVHTEKDFRENLPRASAREGPTPNPGARCAHGNIDALTDPCSECQVERREARDRALGGGSLMDFVRGRVAAS